MKNLEMEKLSSFMTREDMVNTIGGGAWRWEEALYCFALGGTIGVVAYTIGTMQ